MSVLGNTFPIMCNLVTLCPIHIFRINFNLLNRHSFFGTALALIITRPTIGFTSSTGPASGQPGQIDTALHGL